MCQVFNGQYYQLYQLYDQLYHWSVLSIIITVLILLAPTLEVAQTVKNLPAMQETQVRSLGQEDPLEKVYGNPLQYSLLGNHTDRGAWWATVHIVAKSQTRLSDSHSYDITATNRCRWRTKSTKFSMPHDTLDIA